MTGPLRSESMLRIHARDWTFWAALAVLAGVVFLLVEFFPVCVAAIAAMPGGAL